MPGTDRGALRHATLYRWQYQPRDRCLGTVRVPGGISPNHKVTAHISALLGHYKFWFIFAPWHTRLHVTVFLYIRKLHFQSSKDLLKLVLPYWWVTQAVQRVNRFRKHKRVAAAWSGCSHGRRPAPGSLSGEMATHLLS